MNNYLTDIDWLTVGQITFFVMVLAMLILFKRPVSDSQKALKIGAGVFILTILFNLLGITQISEYFGALGFIIISFSLFRLFWSVTSKNET